MALKNAPHNEFAVLYAGRRNHPSNTHLFSPWQEGQRKVCEEIWYVSTGEGKICAENGDWLPIRPGMLVWFRSGVFYRVEQNPNKPIGINFFHFSAKSPIKWEEDISEALETTDPSFVESLSRRIVELYWEEYFEKAVHEGKIPGSEGVPSPRFSSEADASHADFVLPETMGLTIPSACNSDVLRLAADSFHVLVGEYLHLARKRFNAHEVGIQRFHQSAIADIVAKVQSDLANAPSIPKMAAACGYSLDHFGRIFRKIMGCSPQDFLIRIRIARARQLLVESGLSIKEIAIAVGYRSPYFFSRQFKEITGEPPTRFRERHSQAQTTQLKQ